MKSTGACHSPEHLFSRRAILGGMAGTAVGSLSLGSLIHPAIGKELENQQRQVLLIWNDGGMSQLESWDPKPDSPFGGPFRAIPTSVPGIHVSELLPHTAKQMHHLTLVRSINSRNPSHGSAAEALNGQPKNRGVKYPQIGAAFAKLLPPSKNDLPPHIHIKPYSGGFDYAAGGFLGPQYGALMLGEGKPPMHVVRPDSIGDAAEARRQSFRKRANERFTRGRRTADADAYGYSYEMAEQLMKRQDLFDDSKNDPRDVERYGSHKFGRHLLLGRKLLDAGVTFVQCRTYHWDTHTSNFDFHVDLMGRFDRPFAALIEDLAASGRLESTLVIVLSEFGRTPKVNGALGRDHWPDAWSMCMAGGRLQRGAVYGKTNAQGSWIVDGEVGYAELYHTFFRALGIDEEVQYDNAGQPLPIANEDVGPIGPLLA
jgi:hypothetical protein